MSYSLHGGCVLAVERLHGCLWAALLVLASPATAAEISGRIELVSARSGRPARGVAAQDAVVAFVPDRGAAPRVPAEPYEMATVRKSFEPELLVIPVGATVVFPNFDPILHNVFSVTPGSDFDLGIYGRGEGKSATFSRAGVVRVFCNVHQDMYAHILVVETPFFQRVEPDGSFSLTGLPEGGGQLVTWHPQGKASRQEVSSPSRRLDLKIETDRRRVPAHTNKFGKPYRSRRDRYNG